MKPNPETTEKQKQMEKKQNRLERAFRNVANTKDGLEVFRWFMRQCGYNQLDTVRLVTMGADGKSASYGDILPNITIHNSAMRTVWLEARKHLPRKALIEIEIEQEESDDEDET